MKLKYIMRPCIGELKTTKGISQEIELYDLKDSEFSEFDEIIDILDDESNKVGTLKRELLEYISKIDFDSTLRQILEYTEHGIVVIDKDGVIVYANEMYSQLLGVTLGKILGRYMQKIEPEAAIIKVLNTKKTYVLERQHINTINKYVTGKIHPLYVKNRFWGAVSIFKDATEVEILHKEVARVNKIVFNLEQQINAQQQLMELDVIGKNPQFLNMIYQASVAAKTDVPVMILGENGVGKEVIAKYVHQSSERCNKPLVIVNCAAIPENLIESELFGYKGGAFTGAKSQGSIGKFEMANGGTLFLDEIGDMPLTMQTKLLRAIQEKEIEKIGSGKSIKIDTRIITATNQPLEEMVEKKTFRRDLFYRLNLVTLRVPSLRERKEDIGIFADYFLQKFNLKYSKNVQFSNEVLEMLQSYSWPGNVRELQNSIEYGVIMCPDDYFDSRYLSLYLHDKNEAFEIKESSDLIGAQSDNQPIIVESLKIEIELAEKKIIEQVIKQCNSNKSEAMKILGISRRTFYRKLHEHKIM